MTAQSVVHVTSRDNPWVKTLRRLARDATAYRKDGQVWIEGEHLCAAALARGVQPQLAVYTQSGWPQAPRNWVEAAARVLVLADGVYDTVSALDSPARMGFVIGLPARADLLPDRPTVVLDRLQDAGNVGSILRSAAAFGFTQVLALKGTAALWSPKVLRAGMGAHFGLHLIESAEATDLDALRVPLLATSSHQGQWLHEQAPPMPCAWLFGHEGQGVSDALAARAGASVRIAQPGGEESLNVAAAAAICLHASAVAALPRNGALP